MQRLKIFTSQALAQKNWPTQALRDDNKHSTLDGLFFAHYASFSWGENRSTLTTGWTAARANLQPQQGRRHPVGQHQDANMKLALSFSPEHAIRKSCVAALAGVALAIGYSGFASAKLVECAGACTVAITATQGTETLGRTTGQYTIDPAGSIVLAQPITINGDWGSATVDSLGGNADPSLLFGGGSVNNTANPVLFSFATSTPIALNGPVVAQSQLTYGLTAQAGFTTDASLTPFDPGGHLVVANDLRAGGVTNKGVDIGGPCTAPAGNTVSCGNLSLTGAPFGAGQTFTAMGVNVAYFLSGHSSTSFNGQVIQNAVPEPSTYALLAAGLAFVGFTARRRLNG